MGCAYDKRLPKLPLVCIAIAAAIAIGVPGVYADSPTLAEAPATTNRTATRTLAIFDEISRVPRCSKHEANMAAWLVQWAKIRGLAVKSDAHSNVLISVPASPGYSHREPVMLQAHMDMVCQKAEGSSHDFARDPIVPVRDGEWLRASDTTLGADNGIGIAIALAIAESRSARHPPLQLLFTTDEEIDVSGMEGVPRDFVTARRVINIDSEDEGSVTVGSAGGVHSNLTLPLAYSSLDADMKVFALRVDGLLGGHSGLDIDKNRANANVLVAQALSGEVPFRLVNFSGGTAANAITRVSEAIIAVQSDRVEALGARVAVFEREARGRYPNEKQLSLTLTPVARAQEAAPEADSATAMKLVANIPYGVLAWSKVAGLPETSNNIGIVRTENRVLEITTFQRGFDATSLKQLTDKIEARAAAAGASSSRSGLNPVWSPDTASQLYRTALVTYRREFGRDLRTEIVHAGLECGYIAERYPAAEIISIGPTLENVHTTRERLYVPALERFSRFLSALLADL